GGTGATAVVSMAGAGPAALTGLAIVNPGYGYTSAPTIVLTGGGGTGASWTFNSAAFALLGVSTTSAGSGYTSAPTATLPATTGTPLQMKLVTPNTAGGSDQVHLTGNLNVSAGGAFSFVDNFAGEGYYKVLKVDGTTTGSPGSLTVPSVVTNTGPAGKEA